MDLEPTQKCGSFEEGMTTKATLSLSSIECLSLSSNYHTPHIRKALKHLFVC